MQLFSNENINITSIIGVQKYTTTEEEAAEKPIIHHGSTDRYCQLIFFFYGDNKTKYNDVTIYDCEDSIRFLPNVVTDNYVVKRTGADCCIDIFFTADCEMPNTAAGYLNKGILRDKFLKIYNIWQDKSPGYYVKCMAVFYEIIDSLKSCEEHYISKSQKCALDKVYDYIKQHYTDTNFDYHALCGVSGYSYSYFKQLFNVRYNMPPVRFVTKMRIQRSCELLVSGLYSVTEVAEMCGFDNVYYFSSVFKKYMGISPGKYLGK